MKLFRLPRNYRNLFAAALLVVPAALPKNNKPAPKAAPAPAGKLDIRLLITAEPDKVLHPTKAADGSYPQAMPVTVAERGRQLVGFVFFKDCKPDAKGICNLDVDVKGLIPGGAPFTNQKGTDLWRNKKAPHGGFVQLGAPNIKILIEPKDPAGAYRVIAVAHDHNNGAEAHAEASFGVK